MNTFESKTVDDVADWLEDKGIPLNVCEAFKGVERVTRDLYSLLMLLAVVICTYVTYLW